MRIGVVSGRILWRAPTGHPLGNARLLGCLIETPHAAVARCRSKGVGPCLHRFFFKKSNKPIPSFLRFYLPSFPLKPRLRVRSHAERLARGQLAELHFWKFIKLFPYQSNSQNFFKFYYVISLVDASEGSFPVRSRLRKSFQVLLIG